MSTAVGDLVATLGVDNRQFVSALGEGKTSLSEFAHEAEEGGEAVEEFGEHAEEAGGHVGGSSRAFRFLGKEVKELGEGLKGSNEGLGETVEGLGGTVSGLGEAVHGYHAMHIAIEVAKASQIALNLVSPMGWALLAAGAIAAGAAYLHYSSGAAAAAAAAKKAEEDKKEATTETESAIKNLQKEADKLNKTPLEQFQEELAKTGKSADAIAEATEKFKSLSAAIAAKNDANSAAKEIAAKEKELSQHGMSDSQKYVANFESEHPHATSAQIDLVKHQADREDDMKARDKMEKEIAQERLAETSKLKSAIASLTEGPMDKMVAQLKELEQGHAKGLISDQEYAAGLSGLRDKATPKPQEQKDQNEAPQALEFGTAAAYEAIYKAMNPDENQPAKETAANTAKANELLQQIQTNLRPFVLR